MNPAQSIIKLQIKQLQPTSAKVRSVWDTLFPSCISIKKYDVGIVYLLGGDAFYCKGMIIN